MSQPLMGRAARQRARMRPRSALEALVETCLAEDVPWFGLGAWHDPASGHEALCALQRRLMTEARSKAEAALLNEILHDRVDHRNLRYPGQEIAAPGAIAAVFSKDDDWRLSDIAAMQDARALYRAYDDMVENRLTWRASVYQLFGLCLASAIFDAACLSQQDLRVFAQWLLDPESSIEYSTGLPPWADLKERAGNGTKSRSLRMASGQDALGLYRLRRLFLGPRSLHLIAQFWALPSAQHRAISLQASFVEAITFALGAAPSKLRLPQLLRGVALWIESGDRGPDHACISLARREMQSFAATPETWRRALGAETPAPTIGAASRAWGQELLAKTPSSPHRLSHSILQGSAFLRFYMAIHDVVAEGPSSYPQVRVRSRAQMARALRSAQVGDDIPDVLRLLTGWYLSLLEEQGLRPASVERYDDSLGLRLCHVIEDMSLSQITTDDLEDIYLEVIEGDQRSIGERLNLTRRLRSLHAYAMDSWNFPKVDSDIFAIDDAASTMRVRAHALCYRDFVAAHDLLGHAFGLSPQDARTVQAAFLMAFRGGLRLGEVCKALPKHFEDIAGDQQALATLFIRGSRFGSNKTANAARQIRPFALMLDHEQKSFSDWLAWRRSMAQSGPLFGMAQPDGTVVPFERAGLGRLFAESLRLASGLSMLSAHDLRRAALNNVAFALSAAEYSTLQPIVERFSGWTEAQAARVAQTIAGASQREKWEALARFAGHGSAETTFAHYITHADLLVYHSCTPTKISAAIQAEQLQLLGARLVQLQVDDQSRPAPPREIAPLPVGAPSLQALQVMLDCLDRGLPLQRAAAAAQLSIAQAVRLANTAQIWSDLRTSRGIPRLRAKGQDGRLLPASLTKPQLHEALEIAAKLIDMAASDPDSIRRWILTVLEQASRTNAGVTFRDRTSAERWLDIAQALRPAARWQFDRISPEIEPAERRRIEMEWQGVRAADMIPAARRVKAGGTVQIRLRLLAPDPRQHATAHPAKSWAGCITVAAHYAAIALLIVPGEVSI
ncbi:hypothetical protein [Ketogulonicigenium vulgare]|uniref:hypothetical protein n=1 Tax=Ketogulonicigenium vulgare TaxID=92945 RepID=UPI002358FC34|nr:hypothetical protein [Ketogulonicigenium vulgare]